MNINKIAELAGVSRTTISRYLNNGYVSEKNRKKIQKIIDETGYVPSSFAQTLRTKKTNLIGVILPKISSSTISRIVDGISTELKKDGYNVLLGNTDLDIEKEIDYLKTYSITCGLLFDSVKSGKLNKESKILVEAGLYPLRAQTVLPILIPGLPEPNRKIEKR